MKSRSRDGPPAKGLFIIKGHQSARPDKYRAFVGYFDPVSFSESKMPLCDMYIASSADVLLARHAFLPNERLLKRAAHSFPFVPKDQLEITWR